jgi:predicted amidohydrolase
VTAAVRVACVQMRLQPSVPDAQRHALELTRQAAAQGAQLVLLPEYWFIPDSGERLAGMDARFDGLAAWVQQASGEAGVLLAANAPVRSGGKLWNQLLLCDHGAVLGSQNKVHPMPTEERWGMSAAEQLASFAWGPTRLGGLVCADVLHPEAARILALQGAEVLLNPVMSFHKPRDDTKEARRAMFLARAYDNACFVLKAGSVAERARTKLVGRSLVASPWGMLAEARDELGEEVLLADLDLERLREERKRSLSLDRRNPKAYGALVAHGLSADL